MYLCHSLNFTDAMACMLIKCIARPFPVAANPIDLGLADHPGYVFKAIGKVRILANPAGLCASHTEHHTEHVYLPFCVETSALFSPLQVPVPNCREDQHCEAQATGGNTCAFDGASRV